MRTATKESSGSRDFVEVVNYQQWRGVSAKIFIPGISETIVPLDSLSDQLKTNGKAVIFYNIYTLL
jgi:hypothetical protein